MVSIHSAQFHCRLKQHSNDITELVSTYRYILYMLFFRSVIYDDYVAYIVKRESYMSFSLMLKVCSSSIPTSSDKNCEICEEMLANNYSIYPICMIYLSCY